MPQFCWFRAKTCSVVSQAVDTLSDNFEFSKNWKFLRKHCYIYWWMIISMLWLGFNNHDAATVSRLDFRLWAVITCIDTKCRQCLGLAVLFRLSLQFVFNFVNKKRNLNLHLNYNIWLWILNMIEKVKLNPSYLIHGWIFLKNKSFQVLAAVQQLCNTFQRTAVSLFIAKLPS